MANTITHWIDGKPQDGQSGRHGSVFNPATGEVIAEVAACQAEDVNYAVRKARKAFDQGVWSRMHPSDRKRTMIQLVKLMKRHRHELAVLESIDSGKPIYDCANIDVPESMQVIAWHAEAIDKLYDQVAPTGDNALGLIVREPFGVVAGVLPWNCPWGLIVTTWV